MPADGGGADANLSSQMSRALRNIQKYKVVTIFAFCLGICGSGLGVYATVTAYYNAHPK
jgi:patatin-like phospholipase/acyl hydrolase